MTKASALILALTAALAWPAESTAVPLLLTPGNAPTNIGRFGIGSNGMVWFTASAVGTTKPAVLFQVPQAGGSAVQMSPTPADTNRNVVYFAITPDGANAVYRLSNHPYYGDLYSVASSGGSPVQLTTANNVSEGIYDSRFFITPTGDRAVYLARISDYRTEMFSVPINGSQPPARLNTAFPSQFNTGYVDFLSFTPDGSSLLYTSELETSSRRDLYRVSPSGGPATRINTTPGVGSRTVADYALSADGSFVVYKSANLYRNQVTGGAEIPLTSGVLVDKFWISPGGTQTLYTADVNTDNRKELYSVSSLGGSSNSFTGMTESNPNVDSLNVVFGHRADNTDVVAFRNWDADGRSSFYLAPAGGGEVTLLGRQSTPAQYAPPFRMEFNKSSDFLLVQNNATDNLDVYPTHGGSVLTFGAVDRYLLHPDGLHIIYAIQHPSQFKHQIFWSRIDRSESPIDLSNGYTPAAVADMILSPDGRSLLYKTGTLSGEERNLFLAALPIPLPGDFDSDGDVDGADFITWQTNFPASTGHSRATGDADNDGDVDSTDFAVWQSSFQNPPPSGTTAVPEPNAWLLSLFAAIQGAVAMHRRRRNHQE